MDPAFRDQLIGAVRIIIPLILGMGVASGWFNADAVGQITSAAIDAIVAVIALGSVVWSFRSNRQAAQIARVARMPEVKKVVTEPSLAATLKYSPKVASH